MLDAVDILMFSDCVESPQIMEMSPYIYDI